MGQRGKYKYYNTIIIQLKLHTITHTIKKEGNTVKILL